MLVTMVRYCHPLSHWAQRVYLALTILLVCRTDAPADQVLPDCAEDPACLSLYDRARTASSRAENDEALRLYKLAHDVRADPRLLFSIARILHRQGKIAEATTYYARFLASPTEDQEPRQKAQEALGQIRVSEPGTQERAGTPLAGIVPDSSARQQRVPIHKKWWFWTVLGIGVLGATAGIVAGVIVQRNNADQELKVYPLEF